MARQSSVPIFTRLAFIMNSPPEPCAPGIIEPQAKEIVDACPACGNKKFAFYLWGKSNFTPRWFRFCKCPECELVFVNPRISANQIESDVFSIQSAARIFADKFPFDAPEFRFNIVKPAISLAPPKDASGAKRKWLDVGCAVGNMLAVVDEAGYEAHGLELNKKMVEWMRENRPFIHVHQGLWDSLPEKARYNVVSFDNVLEHIQDPNEFLAQAAARLTPDGLLIARVPNFNNFARYLLQRTGRLATSYLIDPDAHPCYYNDLALKRIMRNQGLTPVRVMKQLMLSYPLKHILAQRTQASSPRLKWAVASMFPLCFAFDRLVPAGGIDITVFARLSGN